MGQAVSVRCKTTSAGYDKLLFHQPINIVVAADLLLMCCCCCCRRRRRVDAIYKVVLVYSYAPTDSTFACSHLRWEAVLNTVTSNVGRCRCIVDINGNLAVPSAAVPLTECAAV